MYAPAVMLLAVEYPDSVFKSCKGNKMKKIFGNLSFLAILLFCSTQPCLAQQMDLTSDQKAEIKKVCDLGIFDKSLRGISYAGSFLTETIFISGSGLDIWDTLTGEDEIKDYEHNRDVTYIYHLPGGAIMSILAGAAGIVISGLDLITGNTDQTGEAWKIIYEDIVRPAWGRTGGLINKNKQAIEECKTTVLDYMATSDKQARRLVAINNSDNRPQRISSTGNGIFLVYDDHGNIVIGAQ